MITCSSLSIGGRSNTLASLLHLLESRTHGVRDHPPREFRSNQRRATLRECQQADSQHVIILPVSLNILAHVERQRTHESVAEQYAQKCADKRRRNLMADLFRRSAERAHRDH